MSNQSDRMREIRTQELFGILRMCDMAILILPQTGKKPSYRLFARNSASQIMIDVTHKMAVHMGQSIWHKKDICHLSGKTKEDIIEELSHCIPKRNIIVCDYSVVNRVKKK